MKKIVFTIAVLTVSCLTPARVGPPEKIALTEEERKITLIIEMPGKTNEELANTVRIFYATNNTETSDDTNIITLDDPENGEIVGTIKFSSQLKRNDSFRYLVTLNLRSSIKEGRIRLIFSNPMFEKTGMEFPVTYKEPFDLITETVQRIVDSDFSLEDENW